MAPPRWLLALALLHLALAALVYPLESFFLEDVLSSYLPYARAAPWPGPGNLSHLYFRLVYPLFGERPLPYHLVTAALHLLNVALLCRLAWRLTSSRAVALAAAALMSLHPGLSAVVFITKRVDTLCAVALVLAGQLLLLRWLRRRSGGRLTLAFTSGTLLMGLACSPIVAGLVLLTPLLALVLPGGGRGPCARASAAILAPPALLGGLALAWLGGGDQGSLSELGQALSCFAAHWPDRLAGITSLAHRVVAPLPFTTAGISSLPLPGLILPLGLLGLQVMLAVRVKSAPLRVALLWLSLGPLPVLLQTSPCAGFAVKEKYLYALLPGGCLLGAVLLAGAGRWLATASGRAEAGRRVTAALCVSLCLLLGLGLLQRARHRQAAGRVVAGGVELLRQGLARHPGQQVLALTLLPNEVHGYQTFTGGGDLVPQAARASAPRLRHFTVEYPGYVDEDRWDLYRHLAHVPTTGAFHPPAGAGARLAALVDEGLPLPPGLNAMHPVTWPRLLLAHHGAPAHGIQDITGRALPATPVRLTIRAGAMQGPLRLAGDLAALGPSALPVRDGVAEGTLWLRPGLYRFWLLDSSGRRLTFRSDTRRRHPVRDGVTLLPVVNPALPLGLRRLADTRARQRLMTLREAVMLSPAAPAPRRELARALEQAGLMAAARQEWAAAEEVTP